MMQPHPTRPRSKPSRACSVINNGPTPPGLLREGSNFLKLVRECNNGEVHDRFKQILQDYEQQGTVAVKWMWRNIEQLIADHSELRQGLMSLWMQAKVAVFENKLEDHLPIVDYVHYFEILKSFRNGQKSKAKMVQEIAVLFVNHSDLFDEFYEFVPGDFLK